MISHTLGQGFSNCGYNFRVANKLAWQIIYIFYKKGKSRSAVNLFLLFFRGSTVFQAVSCLLGCLSELSNDNNQPSTSYALLRHNCFIVLTNIDLAALIPTSSVASLAFWSQICNLWLFYFWKIGLFDQLGFYVDLEDLKMILSDFWALADF